jgi:membrane-bound lytic murein transglycosylase B
VEKRVNAALAAYDAALSGLAGAVNNSVSAERLYTQTEQELQAQTDAAGARVRAIYRAGGPMALYVSVLDGASPGDLLDRMVVVQHVVDTDRTLLGQGADALAQAARRAAHAREIATDRARAAARVGHAQQAVQALLAQEQQLLDAARSEALRLTAAENALAAARQSYGAITAARINSVSPISMPSGYEQLYRNAAKTCSGLSWTVLAAIGQVETGHGRNTNTSSAGAQGPMQFMPGTFAAYAVDGDHDGIPDITDPADAIFTAAHYLCANHAGVSEHSLANAIWHYNHAGWYVELVLTLAKKYAEQYPA